MLASCGSGEVEVFVDGVSKIKVGGMVIRSHPEAAFRGAHFQTFFGGEHTAMFHQRC